MLGVVRANGRAVFAFFQRVDEAERVALAQNVPKRPFTNEKLAASVGLTVADFEGLDVSKAACNVVYDALAESRSIAFSKSAMHAARKGGGSKAATHAPSSSSVADSASSLRACS